MIKYLHLFLFYIISFGCFSAELSEYTVNDDELIISSVSIDRSKLPGSVDLYPVEDSFIIAIEPFFDILGLKYQLDDTSLIVWKNEETHSYFFIDSPSEAIKFYWANDGFYRYIDLRVINTLFNTETTFKKNTLSLEIKTNTYQFPVTILEQQRRDRYSDRLSGLYSKNTIDQPKIITIPDEYKLFTTPHGQINGSFNYDDKNNGYNIGAQIVSDLLYHSMSLNLRKSKATDMQGGITLSKYKNSPDDNLLGIFDTYSVGDVGAFSNELVNNVGSGAGIVLSKSPNNYRRTNNQITIEEQAPPGWDVELFHNKRYIDSLVVPETGRVVFNDVLVEWGNNEYEIRLYGPFGEEEIIRRNYQLDSNPLAAGDSAYGVYLLDPNNSVFNNSGTNRSIKLDNFGTSFDYGMSDTWQIGLGFNQVNNDLSDEKTDEQIFTLNNYLSFPGMLLESNLAMNSNDGYAQTTSVAGNLFDKGRYRVSYTSAENFISGRIFSPEGKYEQVESRYSNIIGFLPYSFSYQYRDDEYVNDQRIANTLSYNFTDFRLSNTLSYGESRFKQGGEDSTNKLIGVVNLSTTIFDSIRITGALNYEPSEDDIISDNSSLNAQWTYKTDNNMVHNLSFRYLPIREDNSTWRANYNASWVHEDFRLSLNAFYAENDSWSVGVNINFFLGYDYHNDRALMSSNLNSRSATLNVDTYLDRQLNGVRDPLDYPLEGVNFIGSNQWANITSGENGYTILPGVRVRNPVQIKAIWENGGATINNDYVVYTHPGASIDVNMPFYLETELAGFVFIKAERADFAANAIEIELVDKNNQIIDSTKTDSDGYYEFLKIKPNQYTVRVSSSSLQDKRLNSNIIGYKINTPATGGFIEMPEIVLSNNDDDSLKNEIVPLDVDAINEPLIWNDDQNKLDNYFLMPLKNDEVSAPHQADKESLTKANRSMTKKVNETPSLLEVKEKDLIKKASGIKLSPKDKDELNKELYVIQLAAFVTERAAHEFIQKYDKTNIKPLLTQVSPNNNSYQFVYKALLSAHKTRGQAEQYAQEVNLDNQDYLIVKVQRSAISLDDQKLAQLQRSEIVTPVEVPKELVNKTGWVIQYYAAKETMSEDIFEDFEDIEQLHFGQKILATSGETYNCIVSKPLATKNLALALNAKSEIKGWVLPAASFMEIVEIGEINE